MRIFSIPSISLIEVRIYWKILVWVFGLQEFDLALCAEIFYLTTLVDLFLSNNSRFLPNISNHRLLFLFYTPTPTRFFTKNYLKHFPHHTKIQIFHLWSSVSRLSNPTNLDPFQSTTNYQSIITRRYPLTQILHNLLHKSKTHDSARMPNTTNARRWKFNDDFRPFLPKRRSKLRWSGRVLWLIAAGYGTSVWSGAAIHHFRSPHLELTPDSLFLLIWIDRLRWGGMCFALQRPGSSQRELIAKFAKVDCRVTVTFCMDCIFSIWEVVEQT
jgi:hypothetical protein